MERGRHLNANICLVSSLKVLATILLFHGAVFAGEKKLLHCFAFTVVQDATPADWNAFYKASDALPSKIPGVTRVWYGKLARPLNVLAGPKLDAEANKKLAAGETVTTEIVRTPRQWGMCIEMNDAGTLKSYEAHPYHKEWVDAYSKVRV